jgi:hypothetical protein
MINHKGATQTQRLLRCCIGKLQEGKRETLTVEDGLQTHQAKLLVGKYARAHFGYVENTLHGSKLKKYFGIAKCFAFFAKLAP